MNVGLYRSSRGTNLIASSDWHDVIAAQRKIVKTRGVSVPARHVNGIAANDVGGGAHLDATLAGGAFEKRHFQFDRSAGRNHAGS